MADNFTIPSDRHVFVCGMTGSGKSVLAEYYTRGYKYVVKLDTKNEVDERRREGKSAWRGLQENKDFVICRHLDMLDDIDTDKIIYAPRFEEQNIDTYNMFFRWIFERGNTVLWIDELMSFTTAMSYPDELKRLLIMGRSKGIGVWNCTQRPSGIPQIVTANCTYFFVFTMTLPQDRKRLVETTGMTDMLKVPNGHNFWYYKMGDTKTVKAVLKL